MGIRHLYSHADGYQCELAAIGAGWVMIAAGLPAVDERFVANMDAADRVWLVASDGQRVRVVHEAEAEAVSGIAVSGGERPAWAWTFRSSGVWHVELFEEGRAVVVATSPSSTGFWVHEVSGPGSITTWCAPSRSPTTCRRAAGGVLVADLRKIGLRRKHST